jgi:acyl carrier protein
MEPFEDFAQKIAEILEVEAADLSEEAEFRLITPYWSSLMGFGILVMLEEDYGYRMPVDVFLQAKTVGELYTLIKKRG